MAETTAPTPSEPTMVVVRSYPKIVYLYLTWIASLVCGVLQPQALSAATFEESALIGRIWLGLFVFNILVISFEFSRIRSVAIVFLIIAFILAGAQWGFLDVVGRFLGESIPMRFIDAEKPGFFKRLFGGR